MCSCVPDLRTRGQVRVCVQTCKGAVAILTRSWSLLLQILLSGPRASLAEQTKGFGPKYAQGHFGVSFARTCNAMLSANAFGPKGVTWMVKLLDFPRSERNIVAERQTSLYLFFSFFFFSSFLFFCKGQIKEQEKIPLALWLCGSFQQWVEG